MACFYLDFCCKHHKIQSDVVKIEQVAWMRVVLDLQFFHMNRDLYSYSCPLNCIAVQLPRLEREPVNELMN